MTTDLPPAAAPIAPVKSADMIALENLRNAAYARAIESEAAGDIKARDWLEAGLHAQRALHYFEHEARGYEHRAEDEGPLDVTLSPDQFERLTASIAKTILDGMAKAQEIALADPEATMRAGQEAIDHARAQKKREKRGSDA